VGTREEPVPAGQGEVRRARGRFGIVRARPRLFSSAAVGVVATIALTALTAWNPATRAIVGWDIGVALYLVLAFTMMARSEVHLIRRRAAGQDVGQLTILVLTMAAALASLGAIFAELGISAHGGGARATTQVVLALGTLALSWAFIHTIFALHYAHEFYDETDGGGLAFPGNAPEPDYWDFVYFSLVIGMTSQVSDVGVTSPLIRRTVAAHGVLSFVFNTALLALTINLAASAIAPSP
jgi:uncharacterized membrane protein